MWKPVSITQMPNVNQFGENKNCKLRVSFDEAQARNQIVREADEKFKIF